MSKIVLFSVLLALCLAGCGSSATSNDQPTTLATARSSQAPARQTFPSVTSSPLPPPTASPTPTRSPTLAPTPTASPSPTATPLTCWREGGHFEHGSLHSDLLKLPMEYSVYLPPCYDQQPDRRYPVLYMIHGMSYNHDQWDRLGADEAADALVAGGEVNPFIIVMPRDRSWDAPEADPFGQVLVDALIPFIDETYRTLPEREYRAVGGLSRGAGWAIHLGLSRWELFGAFGGHSPPVFWSDTRWVRSWLAAIPPESMPRIYLDIGEKDRETIMLSALWFENLLNEEGIPHEWYLFSGRHDEAYWSAHVMDYLRWYAAGW